MAFLAVKGAVDHIAGVGQRGRELTVEIGIVLDNEKAQEKLRLKPAGQRAFDCIDGEARHFAIVSENCQQIDEPFGPAAKPRPHQGSHDVAPDRVHGDGEAKDGAVLDQSPAFLLIKAAAREFDGARWVAGLLRSRGRKRTRERKQGYGDHSSGGTHRLSLGASQ
jgi:hypothetical protein